MQQEIDKLSNNNEIFHLTDIVLKGSSDAKYKPFEAIYDTCTDIHVTNNTKLFIASQPEAYAGVIGVIGSNVHMEDLFLLLRYVTSNKMSI